MTRKPSPVLAAQTFAETLTSILNRTVCDNAHVGVIPRGDGKVVLGTGMRALGQPEPVPLRTIGNVRCWLTVVARLYLDPGDYLAVESSVYTFALGDDRVDLLHYDYERDKQRYPDAHLQICAGSAVWDSLLVASGRSRGGLGKLHLPVGGRRYRPALEDIIESLIIERLLDGKPGWKQHLDAGRTEFHRLQLKAAVRRDPDSAVVALERLGYRIAEPQRVVPFRRWSESRRKR